MAERPVFTSFNLVKTIIGPDCKRLVLSGPVYSLEVLGHFETSSGLGPSPQKAKNRTGLDLWTLSGGSFTSVYVPFVKCQLYFSRHASFHLLARDRFIAYLNDWGSISSETTTSAFSSSDSSDSDRIGGIEYLTSTIHLDIWQILSSSVSLVWSDCDCCSNFHMLILFFFLLLLLFTLFTVIITFYIWFMCNRRNNRW